MNRIFAGPIELSPENSQQISDTFSSLWHTFGPFFLTALIVLATLLVLWVIYFVREFLLHKPSPKLLKLNLIVSALAVLLGGSIISLFLFG